MSNAPTFAADVDLKQVVSEAITRLGAREVVRRLGITSESMARIAAGLEIRNGTRALVLANMHLLKATGT